MSADLAHRALSEVAARGKNAIVDGPFGTQLHASDYIDEGVPVVRITNTSFSGRFLYDSVVFISEEKANRLSRSTVRPDDVVVAKTGATIGKVALFPDRWERGIIASSCIKITVDPEVADSRFVCFQLQSYEGQTKIIDAAGGSTRTTINTKPFGALDFLFPPIAEQTKIADILSTVDRAIEQTEALIAKQQRLKTGLMHDLLTRGIDEHGRIRSEETHEFKDSPLGRIPVEWEVSRIDELLAKVDPPMRSGPFGSALLKDELVESGVPLLGIDNVHVERFASDFTRFVEPKKAKSLKRYLVRPGDIMITIMGTVGRCCVVPDDIGLALSSKHTWTISLNPERYSPYLACLQVNHAPWVLHHFAEGEQGGIMASIKADTLRSTLLPVPPPDEMVKIEAALKAVSDEIEIELENLKKSRAIKTTLMQDLLNGRRRVTQLLDGKEASLDHC